MPQKIADGFVLAAMLQTPRELVVWTACSWLIPLAQGIFGTGADFGFSATASLISTTCLYLPLGAMLIARHQYRIRPSPRTAHQRFS